MAECVECGKPVVSGEVFCSNCGTKHPSVHDESNELKKTSSSETASSEGAGVAAALSDEAPTLESGELADVSAASSVSDFLPAESLGGTATGDLPVQVKHTVKKGNTGGHQSTVKQLDPGSVLNVRYEIVRRIGGGGMGAVYLAKDRNLGDAPRAVKEMVEAHLDPAMHEKAIGDFKRESLLLTSLEHPSIPTIYDYFYDESLGRLYLVLKLISGGDLA
jgi:hypothetical protein